MKLTIESTSEIVTINGEITARVWEGVTDSGIRVQCLVTRVAVRNTDDCSQFDRELALQREPSEAPRAFPLQMLI